MPDLICTIFGWIGASAKNVLKEALTDLMERCKHVQDTFDKSVTGFKATQSTNEMKVDE